MRKRKPVLSCGRGAVSERVADSYSTTSIAVVVCTTLPTVAVIVTVYVPDGVGDFMLMVADADLVTSACEIADTVTVEGVGTNDGAAYIPDPSTVPTVEFPPVTPFTCHETSVLLVPLTVAVNCCCSVGNLLAVRGLTLTVIPPPPPPPPPPLLFPDPPHEERTMLETISSASATPVAFFRADGFRASPPIIIPIAESHIRKGAPLRPLLALGRIRVPFGPRVLIESETLCVPLAPAAIEGFEQFAPSGSPLHEKLTATGNVDAPTGVTVRL
jgi:hypothetical protein